MILNAKARDFKVCMACLCSNFSKDPESCSFNCFKKYKRLYMTYFCSNSSKDFKVAFTIVSRIKEGPLEMRYTVKKFWKFFISDFISVLNVNVTIFHIIKSLLQHVFFFFYANLSTVFHAFITF